MVADRDPDWLKTVQDVERRALESGALEPIATRGECIRTDSLDFLVRVVGSLARKTISAGTSSSRVNPFLPYDPHLYVGDVAPRHVCLLNKFQVVSAHVLLVTRQFERQEAALDAGDLEALWRCLREADGIGFYNGGMLAGASQPHKHLQFIPFLDAADPGFPLLPVWEAATRGEAGVFRTALPFPHALERLALDLAADPAMAGTVLYGAYRSLMCALGRGDPRHGDPRPYNLLVTRRWMFAVPREQEKSAGISLNALAFAGGLLVFNDDQLAMVCQQGPLRMLAEVTGTPGTCAGDGPRAPKKNLPNS